MSEPISIFEILPGQLFYCSLSRAGGAGGRIFLMLWNTGQSCGWTSSTGIMKTASIPMLTEPKYKFYRVINDLEDYEIRQNYRSTTR